MTPSWSVISQKNRCLCSGPQSQEGNPNSGSDQGRSSSTAQEAAL